MSLRKIWLYPLLVLLWLGIALWLWQEQQQQKFQQRNSVRAQGQVIIETVASSIRAHSRMAMSKPQRLRVILEEVISPAKVQAIALFDAEGEVLVHAGDETRLDYSLFPGTAESWRGSSLQLWSAVRIGSLSWHKHRKRHKRKGKSLENRENRDNKDNETKKIREREQEHKAKKKTSRRRRRYPPNSQFFLTIALSFQDTKDVHNTGTRLRWIVAIMSSILLAVLGWVWNASLRKIELQASLKLIEKKNQHLEEMNLAANGLAHETKNPLNTLRMTAQTLSESSPVASDWRQKLELIADEADRLAARINEWLAFSRPKEPALTPVSLAELCDELHQLISFDTEEKQTEVVFQYGHTAVWADREMLRQLLFNLLLNSIQAVSRNGRIELRVDIESSNRCSIVVEDDGPGVSPQDRQKLFSPYFTTRENGSGLGLAICRQIVFAHGWDISYTPGKERGSIFSVEKITIANS